MKTTTPPLSRVAAFAAILLLGACQTAGHQRVDATSTRLEGLHESLDRLDEEVTQVADTLATVVEKANEDPQPAYKQLGKDVTALEGGYEHARTQLAEVEKEASRLFGEWTRNSELIADPDLKALSERRRDILQKALDSVVSEMADAVDELERYVSTSRDLHTYLSQDLTPQGIRAIADKSRTHGKTARSISGKLEDVIEAAEKAAPKFETAKPPPPPEKKG